MPLWMIQTQQTTDVSGNSTEGSFEKKQVAVESDKIYGISIDMIWCHFYQHLMAEIENWFVGTRFIYSQVWWFYGQRKQDHRKVCGSHWVVSMPPVAGFRFLLRYRLKPNKYTQHVNTLLEDTCHLAAYGFTRVWGTPWEEWTYWGSSHCRTNPYVNQYVIPSVYLT